MIKVSDSNWKETKEFGEKEWPYANIEHFGKKVDFNGKKFFFKATEGTEIVGIIKGDLDAGVLHISHLLVAHDKRGGGIGKALIIKVEEFGKENGAHKLYLETGDGWEAEKFYEKLGYKKAGVLAKHSFKKDFVIYEKFI